MRAGDGRSGRCSACSARVVRLSFVRRGLNKHVGHAYARASRLFFSLATRNRSFRPFPRAICRGSDHASQPRAWRGGSAVSHARAGLDSPTHSTRQPPCPTSTGVRLTLRRPRLSNHRPARRRARRRGTPRDACRRRQLRFSRAFEVRVAGRGGRRGSLLASPRVPLTTVPPLRAAPHFALPKPQTTRSSRSPTSPPRPRRRRRSRPIPASRTKTRRSRR